MSGLLRAAATAVRSRLRRALLVGLGIALAGAMLATALVIVVGLGGGFSRAAAAADLPDVIVRFNPQPLGRVTPRIRALPDIAAFATRSELTDVSISAHGHRSGQASAEIVSGRRRGYAIVAGHDASHRFGQVVIERGLAQAWGIGVGSPIVVGDLGELRVAGLAEAPDDVGYPLGVPRLYLDRAALDARFGPEPSPQVNVAELWLRDPRLLNEVLVQARLTSYGLRGLRVITRSGVRVLLDQAAGIVIDLLVALSLFALATAAVILAASARAEVQRRLATIGIQRAVGAPRGYLAGVLGAEAAIVAVPAASAGLAAGTIASLTPTDRLLTMLNEPPPGGGLIAPLAVGWAICVAIPVLAAAWPAWRAAGRPPLSLMRGAELRPGARCPHRRRRAPGPAWLGARLMAARRVRLLATVLTLGASAAFILLLLALASALSTLETDPAALGKRFTLSASAPPAATSRIAAIPGVAAAAPRYTLTAADSFSLGETLDVIAFPGDHTVFENPPLTAGRRLRGRHEAEVGAGLAAALGLTPGSTLAIALPSGAELRLRVAGVVSSLQDDGRVAYVPAAALLRADPGAPEQIAIRLSPDADPAAVSRVLRRLGVLAAPAAGATARGASLVAVLRVLLRAIAIVDGLVCLYALVQTCALTVQERRGTIAVLRATGAGASAIRRLLAGAVLTLVAPAAVLGIALERVVLGPLLSRLAAGYASLALTAGVAQIAAVLAGLALAGLLAVTIVTRRASRESVVTALAGT